MDGDFADVEGIVRDAAGRLVGKVVDAGLPAVGYAGRGVELTFGEEARVAVVHAAERDVDGADAVDWGGNVRYHGGFAVFFWDIAVEGVWWLGGVGDRLEGRVGAWEDHPCSKRGKTEQKK